MTRLWVGASVIALSLSMGMVFAQVSATQGEVPKTEFHSPMILEVPADKLRGTPIGEEWEVEGLDKFFCDGVSISRLKISRRRWYSSDDAVRSKIRIYTRPSHDRLVDVTLDILRGEEKILTWTAKEINAEEGKFSSTTKDSRDMPIDEMERLLEGNQPLRLRLTVVVREG